LKHFGYVGGIGASTGSLEGKFWVYDPSDIMAGIPVDKPWTEPTYQEVLGYAKTKIEESSVFSNISLVDVTGNDVPSVKLGETAETPSEGSTGPFQLATDVIGFLSDLVAKELLKGQKTFKPNRHNLVDVMNWFADLTDARWWFEPRLEGTSLVVDSGAYKSNAENGAYERRYFVDSKALKKWEGIQQQRALDSITKTAEENGVQLYKQTSDIDVTNALERDELVNVSDNSVSINDAIPEDYLPPHNYETFTDIDVLHNDALSDMKPLNTLEVFGETRRVGLKDNNPYNNAASTGTLAEEYPYVKVQYTPLLDRGNGYELSVNRIESDKTTISATEQEAKKQLRKHLEETTEGSLQLRGEPHIEPHDYIVTLPVCEDTYTNVDASPIEFEVNAVKHKRSATEQYTTTLGVSIQVVDSNVEVVKSKYKRIGEDGS